MIEVHRTRAADRKRPRLMKPFIFSIIALLAWPLSGLAEYYKYRDENGVLFFSDTHPDKHAGQVEVYQESRTKPQPEAEKQKSGKPPETVVKPVPKEKPAREETKFTLQKNRIMLPVEIVGTRGRATVHLVLDTGAQRTFLWRNALPSIGLRKIGRIRAAGIAGSKYASSVRAKVVKVGPYSMRDAEVAVMSPGRYQKSYDGLLGMDFLSKFEIEVKLYSGEISIK